MPVTDDDAATEGASWSALSIEEVQRLLRPAPVPWWIAGGLAIDLFVGRRTRAHEDTDVQIVRGTELAIAAQLAGWELFAAKAGRLTPWCSREDVNSIWCRPTPSAPWALQLLLADVSDGRWRYRRDRRVSYAVADLGCRTQAGVPFLRPEIQLLYKSKNVRPKDEADFQAALPLLDSHARSWLHDALTIVEPTHRWLRDL